MSMRFFVKAVASGFAMSLGSAIFKKVSKKIGLDEDKATDADEEKARAKAADADNDGEVDEQTGAETIGHSSKESERSAAEKDARIENPVLTTDL